MTEYPDDERNIRRAWQQLAAAWSAADSKSLASAWCADSDHKRLVPSLPAWRGRAEVERGLAEALAHRGSAGRCEMTCNLESVRFLRPDVAIVDGTLEVRQAGGRADGGVTEPFTSVMTKSGPDWTIAASRIGVAVTRRAGGFA